MQTAVLTVQELAVVVPVKVFHLFNKFYTEHNNFVLKAQLSCRIYNTVSKKTSKFPIKTVV